MEEDLFENSEHYDESVLRNLLNSDPFEIEAKNSKELNTNESFRGFDKNMGDNWIYPINYPMRDYQFNISQAALFDNVLVALPTGLGKTFIAAVVMYNFYRWYPLGKIIFLAPTKPLVHQQLDACYNVTAITPKDSTVMTGKCTRSDRKELWKKKRVFFATPQTIQSELCSPDQEFPFKDIKLVVIDEAHKAKKNYAYTKVVELIHSKNRFFRILALSATPGKKIEDVIEVCQNLMISRVESRWDESIDVRQYTHKKNLKTVVVALGPELRAIKATFMEIMEPYMQTLIDFGVVSGNLETQSKNWIIHEQQKFFMKYSEKNHPNHTDITANYAVLISLFHALELLERQGLYQFISFFYENGQQKYFLAKDPCMKKFLNDTQENYAPNNPFNSKQTVSDINLTESANKFESMQGHPKYKIMAERLAKFYEENPDSKTIIFCEFRDSTLLAERAIRKKNNVNIKSRIIIGQGSGKSTGGKTMSQKEQLAVMKDFRTGAINTLIATSVCEEGIDIGEVDLIICLDISSKNPTRFTQRIGRTGRKRKGQVMILVTEGKEHNNLKSVIAKKDETNQKIANNSRIKNSLLNNLPQLIPPNFHPKCLKVFIKVPELPEEIEKPKRRKKNGNVGEVDNLEVGPSYSRNKNKEYKTSTVLKFFKSSQKNENDDNIQTEAFDPIQSINDVSSTIMNTTKLMKLSPEDQFHSFQQKILKMKFSAAKFEKQLEAKEVLMNVAYPKMLKKLILAKNQQFLKDTIESESLLTAMEEDDDVVDLDSLEEIRTTFNATKVIFGSIDNVKSFLRLGEKSVEKVSIMSKFDNMFNHSIVTNTVFQQKLLVKCQNMLKQSLSPCIDIETSLGRTHHTNPDLDSDQLPFVEVESKYQQTNTSRNQTLSTKNNIFNSTIKTPISEPFKSRKPKFMKKVTTPIAQSPLFKAFQNVNKKRSLTNCQSTPKACTENNTSSKIDEKAVLGFLGLTSIDDIFADDESDEEISPVQPRVEKIDTLEHITTHSGTSRGFLSRLEENIEQKSKVSKCVNSDLLWLDDGMDDELCQFSEEPKISESYKAGNAIYSVPKILEIIDQLEDEDVIESSQPMIFNRCNTKSVRQQIQNNDQEELFCDSESDIFKSNSTSPFHHDVSFNILDQNNENSNSSDKTIDYNYDSNESSKENALSKLVPPPTSPTSSSKEEAKSPSIFDRNITSSKLAIQTQSSHVLKPQNQIPMPHFASSPISSIAQRSANSFERNQLIKAVTNLSEEALLTQSPIGVAIRKSKAQIISSDEEESQDFFATCKSTLSKDEPLTKLKIAKKSSRNAFKFSFLDIEASADGHHSSDEDSEDDISSFICDSMIIGEEEIDNSAVDIQAKYLESLRSPSNRKMRGGFKIPQVKTFKNISDIYSQMPLDTDVNEYEEDSFIVIDEDHHVDSELDELERAEAILKAKRRAKKFGSMAPKGKKRRIIQSIDSSEDDEMNHTPKRIKTIPG